MDLSESSRPCRGFNVDNEETSSTVVVDMGEDDGVTVVDILVGSHVVKSSFSIVVAAVDAGDTVVDILVESDVV